MKGAIQVSRILTIDIWTGTTDLLSRIWLMGVWTIGKFSPRAGMVPR